MAALRWRVAGVWAFAAFEERSLAMSASERGAVEGAPEGAATRALLLGARDTLPLLPGTIPFGLIYGAAALAAHISPWLAQAMSVIVFAGSAQFAIVLLVSGGASALVIVVTAVTLNARHLLYSASLGPSLRQAPRGWRLALSYLLVDEVYGVVIGRIRALPMPQRLRYMLGSGLTLWIAWQLSTLVGILIGARIPASWSLDFAATLTFIALLTPLLRDRALVFAALVAAIVAALTLGAPLKLGFALAALAGIAAGILFDRLSGTSGRRKAAAGPTADASAPLAPAEQER